MQHVIVLAERNPRQYISQCEHGTVNLIWDGVGIHLPATQFVLLAERIRRAHAHYTGISTPQDGCFHLQVGKLVVLLPMSEFTLLVEIISAALPLLDQSPEGGSLRVPRLRFPNHPLANVLN